MSADDAPEPTEELWLVFKEPDLDLLGRFWAFGSPRKWELFAVACCRRIWRLMPTMSRRLVERLERQADEDVVATRELEAAIDAAREEEGDLGHPQMSRARSRPRTHAARAARRAGENVVRGDSRATSSRRGRAAATIAFDTAQALGWTEPDIPPPRTVGGSSPGRKLVRREHRAQCGLLREILGNPFRDVAANGVPPRLVEDAEAIDESKQFDDLPVLADELEVSGFDGREVLEHLRSGAEHVRGCWALDLVMGRE